MDIKERLLVIRIIDQMKDEKMKDTVKRISLTDVSYFREEQKKCSHYL